MINILKMSLLIDVRTAEEFNEEHAEGALHLPVDEIAKGEIGPLINVSKEAQIKLYCRSGTRSEMAKELLKDLGFKRVENLGGLDDLKLKKML